MAYRFTTMTIEPVGRMHNLKILLFSFITVFVGFFACTPHALALDIKGMRFGNHGNAVRAVIELNQEADFRAYTQANPPRIILELPAISSKPTIKRSDMPAIIGDIQMDPVGGNHTRLTFALNDKAIIRSAFLMPSGNNLPARLVLDFSPAGETQFNRFLGKPYGTLVIHDDPQSIPFAGISGPKLAPVKQPERPKAPEELPLVYIDAGHGGIDSGAVGGGVQEKDVTLSVARALKKQLDATGRYRTRLTRDRDTFIRLQERTRIARRADADLFISIHADSVAGNGENISGASFYTLSDRASDMQTQRLAERENQADLLAGIELPKEDKEVASILIDLAMRETMNQSNRFAGNLEASFTRKGIALLPDPRRHAGFMVLKAPDMPSILIELGFLSNPGEVQKLADGQYRAELANAIARGVDAWFKTRNP